MGTGVVDRKVLTVHVEDGDLLSAHLDPLSTPKGDVLSLCYLHKSCHGLPIPLSYLLCQEARPKAVLRWQLPAISSSPCAPTTEQRCSDRDRRTRERRTRRSRTAPRADIRDGQVGSRPRRPA